MRVAVVILHLRSRRTQAKVWRLADGGVLHGWDEECPGLAPIRMLREALRNEQQHFDLTHRRLPG